MCLFVCVSTYHQLLFGYDTRVRRTCVFGFFFIISNADENKIGKCTWPRRNGGFDIEFSIYRKPRVAARARNAKVRLPN